MTRLRSPNYPSLSLKQSIDMVAKIHRAARTNVITREDAAQSMGYTGLTGRSMTVIAALVHFGLLVKAGKGDVRVTPVAVEILHGDETEHKEAILKAAFTPQLFRDIHDRFPDGIPTEGAIKSYLIKQEFSDAAVGPAINAFMETYREVENIRESESYGDATIEAPEPPPVQPQEVPLQPATVAPLAPIQSKMPPSNDGPLDFNLSSAGLSLSGMTKSASDLKAFIERLKLLASLLPDQEDLIG